MEIQKDIKNKLEEEYKIVNEELEQEKIRKLEKLKNITMRKKTEVDEEEVQEKIRKLEELKKNITIDEEEVPKNVTMRKKTEVVLRRSERIKNRSHPMYA